MPQIINLLNCKLSHRYTVKDVSGSYIPSMGGDLGVGLPLPTPSGSLEKGSDDPDGH